MQHCTVSSCNSIYLLLLANKNQERFTNITNKATQIIPISLSAINRIPAGDYPLPQPRITTSCPIFYTTHRFKSDTYRYLVKLTVTIVALKRFNNYFYFLCADAQKAGRLRQFSAIKRMLNGMILVRGWAATDYTVINGY